MLIASFLRIAREDLDAARLLAPARNRNTIYHCEQAAEKIIRAVLTSEGIPGRISHELEDLIDPIPDDNPIKPVLRGTAYLAAYATSYRYPTQPRGRIRATPQALELQDAIDKVAAALTEVAERFGVDLDHPDTPARRPGPIR
ncbi:HEPN domain-containing protein [Nannocystis radixulma]|uniref:HEPN domain-containing protein n=1 Tax=Nannocystis radixulma TaxID=2995305 RepID=A0ABT5B9D0_9BACT|nr:HEPN domain-containing protein [Nannocystis radixulma]MDC0670741.1 HEPN domain-containing protein [Nannocystis radixulma]